MAEFDSSITAYFGGDTSGLAEAITQSETMVQGLDRRFDEMGVAMAGAPKKFAEESAKAFADVEASEKTLSDYREEQAFRRMSDEEKLATLQRQALTIREQVLAMDGNSVEKQQLLLDYEKKKTQIYDLNQKIAAETAATEAAAKTETSEHVGVMGMLEEAGQKVKKAFHEMGVSLHGMGFGLIIAEAINLTREAVGEAQKQRDEYEKIGKTLDASTRSLAMFGDGMHALKSGASSLVGFIVSGWTQIGDLIGSGINRMRGINEAQENYAMASQRAADAAQARVEKLKEEQHDVEKIAAARKNYADTEANIAKDTDNVNRRAKVLADEYLKVQKELQNTEVGTVAYWERKAKLAEATNAMYKEFEKVVVNIADKQMQEIKTYAPLAITYSEKRTNLFKEQAVLTRELSLLEKGSTEYEKVSNSLKQNGVALTQLDREYRAKMALSEEDILFIFRAQHGLLQSATGMEGVRLEILKKQAEEKRIQLQVDELVAKKIATGLTPAEEDRLATLLKQKDTLDKQILVLSRQKGVAIDYSKLSKEQLEAEAVLLQTRIAQLKAEGGITDELERQLAIINEILNKKKEIAKDGGVLGLHDLSNVATDVLAAKAKELQAQIAQNKAAASQGAEISDYGVQFANSYLQSQVDSIAEELKFRASFSNDYLHGGRSGALAAYTAAGRDPLGFDTALQNMQSWNNGLDITNQSIQRIENLLKDIFH